MPKIRGSRLVEGKTFLRLGALTVLLAVLAPAETQNAVANGDTRTLTLYHTHTRESISATFRVNGQYDPSVLEKLNWFLRDWRLDEPTKMDPRLFDVVWDTYRESGSAEPIHIVSAYRSPQTNAMLRRRSKAVAEFSQHMLGKAMDMHYVDVPMSRVREIGMKLQRGGVGYYPTAGSPFVHLDVGNVRAWPRMNYDQLARLFPDGKTVHLPTNGQPLARYEEARAEIQSRGGASMPTVAEVKSKGFFASLFGGGGSDEEDTPAPAPARGGPRSRVATYLASRDQKGEMQVASNDEGANSSFFMSDPARRSVERAERDLPRGETYLAPVEPVMRATPAAAPIAPARPAAAAAPVDVFSDKPLPPRRPADLAYGQIASIAAPLPPARPTDLRSETTSLARASNLPSVITGGSTGPATAPSQVLAFAPSAGVTPDPARAAGPRIALRSAASSFGLRPTLPPQKTEFVAARLDRGNFGPLTTPLPVARNTATPPSPPARPNRSDIASMIFSQPANVATTFGRTSGDLSATGFTGPAVRALPRLEQRASNDPASRLN